MSRPFTFECECCGHTWSSRKFALPEAWMLIHGQHADLLMCAECARKAVESCEHKDEKLVPTGGMYVQCQRCGRQRYLVNM